MHGKTSTASQASTGGHARHAETARTDRGNSRARPARSTVPVPPSADDRENNFAGQWPLQSFLELGALPGAVPCARVHARQMLWEWGVTELADVTELVISNWSRTPSRYRGRTRTRPGCGFGCWPTRRAP